MGVDFGVAGGWGIVLTETKLESLRERIEEILGHELDVWECYELAEKYGLEAVEASDHMSGPEQEWLFGFNTFHDEIDSMDTFGFGTTAPTPSVDKQIKLDRFLMDLGLGLNYKPQYHLGFWVS